MSEKRQQAIEMFAAESCYNCAQSVIAVFAEKYGMSREDALRVSGGLGAGVRCGEICGAANGGVLVVGLAHGQTKHGDAEAKKECDTKAREYLMAFVEKNGKLRCKELLGYDPGVPEELSEIKRLDLRNKVCKEFVGGAVTILEELGY